MSTTLSPTPAVWVGCMACYNAGKLVGEWVDAVNADKVTIQGLHTTFQVHDCEGEELWVFDTESLPIAYELDPTTAVAWGKALEDVESDELAAFAAWAASDAATRLPDSDVPDVAVFHTSYQGQWESFSSYAHNYAEETGLLEGLNPEVTAFFDWNSWIDTLKADHEVVRTDSGSVYVFTL